MMSRLYVVLHRGSVFECIHEIVAAETILGRGDDCALPLPDLCVSRKHALLMKRETDFLVRDLGSRNGTRLSGHLVQSDAMLLDGSEVQIGPYRLTMRFDVGQAIRDVVSSNDSTCSAVFPPVQNGNWNSSAKKLTPAQQRVYDGFLEGLSEKEVATRLRIAITTVHDHAKAIYKTLSVCSRAELLSNRDAKEGRTANGCLSAFASQHFVSENDSVALTPRSGASNG